MEVIISIVALMVSISGVTWTVWYNLNRANHERTTRSTELNLHFYQDDMVHGRETGWALLDSLEESPDLKITFKFLWDNQDQRVREQFRSLYKVLSFWLTLQELGAANKIDKELAKRLFTYEYEWWFWRVQRMVEDTPEGLYPDVFQPFIGEGIEWMPRTNHYEGEPRSRKKLTK